MYTVEMHSKVPRTCALAAARCQLYPAVWDKKSWNRSPMSFCLRDHTVGPNAPFIGRIVFAGLISH